MDVHGRIFAGHRDLVGAAVVRRLEREGADNLVLRTHAELDLIDQDAVDAFFAGERPDYVFLCATRVGGIHANDTYPAEFTMVSTPASRCRLTSTAPALTITSTIARRPRTAAPFFKKRKSSCLRQWPPFARTATPRRSRRCTGVADEALQR